MGIAAERAMRWLRSIGRGLVGVAALFVLAAWLAVWSQHRDEVRRQRFAFGPDARVPAFNPVNLVNPEAMPVPACAFYICAFAAVVPGLVCLILARRK
jgi:peptidoglycan/LPS O-acetylase OafA/YrhL